MITLAPTCAAIEKVIAAFPADVAGYRRPDELHPQYNEDRILERYNRLLSAKGAGQALDRADYDWLLWAVGKLQAETIRLRTKAQGFRAKMHDLEAGQGLLPLKEPKKAKDFPAEAGHLNP